MTELEADPFADWPARTPLYDEDGGLALIFTLSEGTRSGLPWADGAWRPASADLEKTVETVMSALGGYAFSTSDLALAEALEAAGAKAIRHAHVMSHPLVSVPAVRAAAGLTVEPLSAAQLTRHADRLGDISFRAYPVGHPDHEHKDSAEAARELRAMARGEILGPLMTQSRIALVAGEIVGACIVVDREGVPPDGGPWIVDIFRDVSNPAKGVGKALLDAVLADAKAAGLPGVSLAVSHSNANAFGLYGAMGFHDDNQSWTLAVPTP